MLPRRSDFMRREGYARAVASEIVSPGLRALARASCGPSTPRSTWRRGLIVAHSHLGDVLYRTASLDELHAALPHVSWDFLTSAGAQPLLDHNPAVRSALPLMTGEDDNELADGALDTLRRAAYDVVLCSNTLRVLPDFTLALALRAPNRVGVSHKGATGLLSHALSVGPPAPYPIHFRRMVEQLAGRTFDSPVRPRIHLSASDRAEAADVLRSVALAPATRIVACTLSARQSPARWPLEFFTAALELLHARAPIVVLLGGAPDDAPVLLRVAAAMPFPAHVVAGRLSLRGFAALLERCDLLLAPDSGPRHIANAVGTPVVFARNLAEPAVATGVYCDTETDVAPPGSYLDASTRRRVMASASPEIAADAMKRWLQQRRSR